MFYCKFQISKEIFNTQILKNNLLETFQLCYFECHKHYVGWDVYGSSNIDYKQNSLLSSPVYKILKFLYWFWFCTHSSLTGQHNLTVKYPDYSVL